MFTQLELIDAKIADVEKQIINAGSGEARRHFQQRLYRLRAARKRAETVVNTCNDCSVAVPPQKQYCERCRTRRRAAKHARWYVKNREKVKAYLAEWQKGNRDKIAVHHRRYYEKNKEAILEKGRAYRASRLAKDPEGIRAAEHQRYLRKKEKQKKTLLQIDPEGGRNGT